MYASGKRTLVYLAEIVEHIEAFASQQEKLNQVVDNAQLPLHHSYMKSSAMNEVNTS